MTAARVEPQQSGRTTKATATLVTVRERSREVNVGKGKKTTEEGIDKAHG